MRIDDKAPTLDWDDALQAIDIKDPPREVLAWASENWDDVSSSLIRRLGEFAAGRREVLSAAEAFYIVHFCAEKAETRVYPILCRLIGEDRRIADWLDDAVTETLPGVLIRVFNGDSMPLRRAIESAKGDEFARASALAALGYLVRAKGAMSDDDMRAYLARLRQEAGPRRESVLWMTWATTVANLGYSDMRAQVEALVRDGLFPEGDFTREEFHQRVARARSDASGLAGFRSDLVAPLNNASAAILSLAGVVANHAGRRLRAIAGRQDCPLH
jgi:hypothetical protein